VDRACGLGPLVHDEPVITGEGYAIRHVHHRPDGCGCVHTRDGSALPACGNAEWEARRRTQKRATDLRFQQDLRLGEAREAVNLSRGLG
jgi:hypothetical protein